MVKKGPNRGQNGGQNGGQIRVKLGSKYEENIKAQRPEFLKEE